MSAEVFRLVILGICAMSTTIATYYRGKTMGFSQGYDVGYSVGYMVGEFKALIKRNMDEGGDAE